MQDKNNTYKRREEMSTETAVQKEARSEYGVDEGDAVKATVQGWHGAPERVAKPPYRDRLAVGVSRSMTRTVALHFRVRNGKPPETISRHHHGPHAAEYLELIPAALKSPSKTAIVYFHGGGWISGSSDIATYRLLDFAAAGHPASTSSIRWLQSIPIRST